MLVEANAGFWPLVLEMDKRAVEANPTSSDAASWVCIDIHPSAWCDVQI